MPIARRTPISRIRSTTPIVSVLTMPERRDDDRDDREGVEDAEDASQRLGDGALDALDRVGLEGEARGPSSRSAGRAVSIGAGREANGEGVGAEDAQRFPWRPSSRRGSPRRWCPASTAPRSRRPSGRAPGRVDGQVHRVADLRAPSDVARPCGQDRGAAGVEGRERRRIGRRLTIVRRPSARKSAPTTAAASTRMPRKARSKEAIGVTRPRRERPRGQPRPARRGRSGRMEVTISSPGHDVVEPGERGGARGLGGPAEGHDHREADDERAEGQRRPAAIAGERAAGEPLLDPQEQQQGQAEDPRQRPQDERREQRRGQEDAVDGERALRAVAGDDRRPGQHRERGDDAGR